MTSKEQKKTQALKTSYSTIAVQTQTDPASLPGAGLPQKELTAFNHYWRCMDDIYHDLARKIGLSDSALIILYGLHTLGDGSLQRDICRQASVSKQTIHSSIRNLERDGYLRLDDSGGRDKRIWLTDQGRELIHHKIVPIVALENAAFAALGPEKSQTLIQLSQQFVEILRTLADGNGSDTP